MRRVFLILFIFLVSAPNKAVALPALNGDDPVDWEARRFSWIIAEVRDVTSNPEQRAEHRAKFYPLATLAGSFDVGIHPMLSMNFWISGAINQPPREGDIVMAVIHPNYDEEGFYVYAGFTGFMPGSEAMVTITGIEDEPVLAAVDKLHTLRLKGRSSGGPGVCTRLRIRGSLYPSPLRCPPLNPPHVLLRGRREKATLPSTAATRRLGTRAGCRPSSPP